MNIYCCRIKLFAVIASTGSKGQTQAGFVVCSPASAVAQPTWQPDFGISKAVGSSHNIALSYFFLKTVFHCRKTPNMIKDMFLGPYCPASYSFMSSAVRWLALAFVTTLTSVITFCFWRDDSVSSDLKAPTETWQIWGTKTVTSQACRSCFTN